MEPTTATDAELIAASRSESARFATVFDRHFDAIHRYLARRTGRDTADDLAGDVFRIAFEGRDRYDAGRPRRPPMALWNRDERASPPPPQRLAAVARIRPTRLA